MRDITLDQLKEYLSCGEYFKQHMNKPKKFPLKDKRQSLEIMIFSLIRWMLNYQSISGILPSEEEIMLKIGIARARLAYHGHPFLFSNQINDVNLSLLGFRQTLAGLSVDSSLSIKRFRHSKTSLIVPILLTTPTTQYHFSSLPHRHFLNSPEFLLPGLLVPRKKHIYLQWAGGDLKYKEIQASIDFDKAEAFYKNVLEAISMNLFMPISKCQEISCSHYKQCHIAKT